MNKEEFNLTLLLMGFNIALMLDGRIFKKGKHTVIHSYHDGYVISMLTVHKGEHKWDSYTNYLACLEDIKQHE